MNGCGLIGTILVNANAKGEVRGYVSSPMYMQGYFASYPLYRVKTVRISPFITAFRTSAPLCCCMCTSNPDFTIQAVGGFIIRPMPNTKDETICFIMLCI